MRDEKTCWAVEHNYQGWWEPCDFDVYPFESKTFAQAVTELSRWARHAGEKFRLVRA